MKNQLLAGLGGDSFRLPASQADARQDAPQTHFDAHGLTIQVWTGEEFYEVDLETCLTSAQLLDWIYELRRQWWGNSVVVEQFLECVDEACRQVFGVPAPAAVCPDGVAHRVDWIGGKAERIVEDF